MRHAWLTDRIRAVHAASRGTYGARRVQAELVLVQGIAVGHQAVERLMRVAGLRGLSDRPRYRKSAPQAAATDRVGRQFTREAPDQLWVTDSTEHPTREGKVYCAVVLDACSHRVVGWSIDAAPTAVLVTNALRMAIETRRPAGPTVIHSDQGRHTARGPSRAAPRTRACCPRWARWGRASIVRMEVDGVPGPV